MLAACVLLASVLLLASCTASETETPQTPVSASAVILSPDGGKLYVTNGDANTVSVVDVRKRKVIKEIPVGRDPRTLALSPDGKTLYVACRNAGTVEWVDVRSGKVLASLKTGIEPYGVVVSPDGKRLYVSNYRSGTLVAADTSSRRTVAAIKLGGGLRALALTADGSVLYAADYRKAVIHRVSTAGMQAMDDIALAASPDARDRKASQGAPNAVEQIRLTPDGSQAWIAHQLTNTDTPIQFEETVFPAVSVVDVASASELPERRKQLFRQLDVKDKFGKTMIVSDPTDLLFSPDGKLAYELMGGSEDLVVYDLSRGGRAVQIVRRIPGDRPTGMAVSPDGRNMFVANMNSHDLVFLKLKDKEGHANARVDGTPLRLIAFDPLSPQVRLGKTAFYSANSDEFPLSGNNWMSCATCHSDGETDGMTLLTGKGPRNVPSNVLAMETGLFMWDGSRDDFDDYVHTVQGEMGGFEGVDPGKPLPADVRKLMDAIKAYLEEPDSFPVPQSPYRQADGSMTADAEAGERLFKGKASCIACHAGDMLTDSTKALDQDGRLTTAATDFLYDVGTVNPLDKDSAGDARAGYVNPRKKSYFDVPTLRGVWATAPYLHDGSAETLSDVVERAGDSHGTTSALTESEIDQLVAYLKQIQ